MGVHLDALGDWLERNSPAPGSLAMVLDETAASNDKLGRRTAHAIIVDIADRSWPVGETIGSEASLIERYQISRSALREAVRLLEYHEVATMRRGPGGGLVVTSPGIGPIVRAATVFLEYRGITPADLMHLRRNLESDAVALVAQRATPDDIARLRAVGTLRHRSSIDDRLHVAIAELTGNHAIALFVRVLVELTRLHYAAPPRGSGREAAIAEEVAHAQGAIIDAIAAGDPELARRRMAKHLTAMEPLLR